VGPRDGLDAMAWRKNPCPYQESDPGCADRSLVTTLNELSLNIKGANKWIFMKLGKG